MKKKISLMYILLITAIGLFLASSCSPNRYSVHHRIDYKRAKRVKVYQGNSSRKPYTHVTPVKKKWVLKK